MFRVLTYKTGNRDYRSWNVNTNNTIIFFFIIVTTMTKFIFKCRQTWIDIRILFEHKFTGFRKW